MDVRKLLSGIAVVIDDQLDPAGARRDADNGGYDPIFEIVERMEREWGLPFYKSDQLPPEDHWPGLLQSASFILLDWKLWPHDASQLEQAGVEANNRFLGAAKRHFVPVFVFTNESVDDVGDAVSDDIYREGDADRSFVFIQSKADVLMDGSLNLDLLRKWMASSASVYALKTWDRLFFAARSNIFGSMYEINPDWPRVFWRTYEQDGVDPSFGLTQLIGDCLLGGIRTNAFGEEVMKDAGDDDPEVPAADLRKLIEATTFRPVGRADDIRCGDLFKRSKRKYWLNIRPDCDCIPRGAQKPDRVEVYCIEGERIADSELNEVYDKGHFVEQVDQSIVFAAFEGETIRFRFKKLRIKRFGEVKESRVGRVLHPVLTRIQQRYALYLQRQGLPAIPKGAVSNARASK